MAPRLKRLTFTKPKTAYGLLRAVIKAITEEPLRLDMDRWLARGVEETYFGDCGTRRPAPVCDTVGCIAGWCTQIAKPRVKEGFDVVATRLLGFKPQRLFYGATTHAEELSSLFLPNYWPSDLRHKLDKLGSGTPEYATVVVERIERFIDEHRAHLKRTKIR